MFIDNFFTKPPELCGWADANMYSVDFTNSRLSNSKTGRYVLFAIFNGDQVSYTNGVTVYSADRHESNPIHTCSISDWESMNPKYVCCINKSCSCESRYA